MSSSLVESLISSPEPVGQHKYHPGSSVLSRAGRFSSYTLLAVCSTSSLCLPIMHLCCSAAEPHKPDPPLRTFIKQLRVDKSNCNQSESRDLRACVLPLLSERLLVMAFKYFQHQGQFNTCVLVQISQCLFVLKNYFEKYKLFFFFFF